ncbi:hypothetical protein HA402_005708 [Bradysia odoriphaga]|nr:hypothetical protein HA402_005708 [Bradysia odoriphaga]
MNNETIIQSNRLIFFLLAKQSVAGSTVYVSGCLGLDLNLKLVPGGAGPEMRRALENMAICLEASGSCVENVVKATIFITDLNDSAIINEEYAKGVYLISFPIPFRSDVGAGFNVEFFVISVFNKHPPARSMVQVSALALGAKLELEVIAMVGDVKCVERRAN